MKSNVWYLLISIVVFSMLVTACSAPATNPPAATEAPATEAATEAPATEAPATSEVPVTGEAIKIGASLPLTGDFSEPGTAARMGYELWFEQVNNAGGLLGRQVELTV